MDSVFIGLTRRAWSSVDSAADRNARLGWLKPNAGPRLKKSWERCDLSGQTGVEEDYAGVDEGAVSSLVAPVMEICGNVLRRGRNAFAGCPAEEEGLSLVCFERPRGGVEVCKGQVSFNHEGERRCRIGVFCCHDGRRQCD